MGIVYKITPELIDFLRKYKQDNPSSSCRALTAVVHGKYHVKLSKSSINTILKDFGLASPVQKILPKQEAKPAKLPQISAPAQGSSLLPAKICGGEAIPKSEIASSPPAAAPRNDATPAPPAPEEKPPVVVPPLVTPPVEKPLVTEPKITLPPAQIPPAEKPPVVLPPVKPTVIPAVSEPALTEAECSGIIIAKAADALLGGAKSIAAAIGKFSLGLDLGSLSKLTEELIFTAPEKLQGQALAFLESLEKAEENTLDEIQRAILNSLALAHCVKVNLADNTSFYLDGQFHAVWPTPNIPYGFCAPLNNVKSSIEENFLGSSACELFMAGGYENPSAEFFDFMLAMDTSLKKLSSLVIYGGKQENLGTIRLEEAKKRQFIFGLWPWQFASCRKVNSLGEYKRFTFALQNREFYLAPIELTLAQPQTKETIVLRGCALKSSLEEKIRLAILSNIPAGELLIEELAARYLSRWPNLEEGFQDYSRKVELFTYSVGLPQALLTQKSSLGVLSAPADIKSLFAVYLEAVESYVKTYLLPADFPEKEFPQLKGQLYGLKVKLKKEKSWTAAKFETPAQFAYQKILQHILRRLNESGIELTGWEKAWFSCS